VSNICPSLFFIVQDENTAPYNEHDIFRPDSFKIINSEHLTHVKEINSNTKETLQVRLLCCYRVKDCLGESYCEYRKIDKPAKKVCNTEDGNMTDFIHFHIIPKKLDNCEYLLAFIEASDLNDNTTYLVSELVKSINWLKISAKQVFFNIFTFGEPIFNTGNTSYVDYYIESEKKRVKNDLVNIECEIQHIGNDYANRLSISVSGRFLSFQPS
jgi:hypothetical protein